MTDAFLIFDRIARAAFAASGAYLIGGCAFRLLGTLVGGDFDEVDNVNRKEVITR